jgi:hypothetical protein
MMKNRRVLLGVLVVVAVVALTATATYAYFSGFDNTGNNVTMTMATIGVESIGGFPLELRELLPGQTTAEKDFTVKNTGSAPIDVYAWLVGTDNDPVSWGTEANFCSTDVGARVRIWNSSAVDLFNSDVCNLFPISGGKAVKLVGSLAPGDSATFGIALTLPTTLGNAFQGLYNVSPVTFMATQEGIGPSSYDPQVVYINSGSVAVSQVVGAW